MLDLRLSSLLFDLGNSGNTFDFAHIAQVGLSYSDGIGFTSAGGLGGDRLGVLSQQVLADFAGELANDS